jgi:hypothetical protein
VKVVPISTTERGSDSPIEVAGGFPRHLTQELLDEDTRRSERRRWLAPWFLGAAFALFSLAFPLLRVVGNFPLKAEAGEGLWYQLLALGWGEDLGFLLSALTAGLLLPMTTHALVATGLPRGPALVAALCVGLSPLLVHAAVLPGPEATAALLALAAFWIVAPHDVGALRTSVGVAVGVGVALLEPGGLLILPALLARHFSRTTQRIAPPKFVWYGVAWGVAAVVAMELLWPLLIPEVHANQDPRVLRFGIFPGVFGFALALLATVALFRDRKESLAEDAPTWLRLWVAGGVLSLLLPGASGVCLLPAAAFAIADILSRDLTTSRTGAAVILAAQLTLTLAAVHQVRSRDPNAGWRGRFLDTAQEGDHLISSDPTHRYLARFRWGFQASPPTRSEAELSPPFIIDLGELPPFVRRVSAPTQD